MRYTFILLILTCQYTWGSSCHPDLNPQYKQYMIGYGSLISESSKRRTCPFLGDNIPVMVKGYHRLFNVGKDSQSNTYLGIVQNLKATFNGVIFEIPLDKINYFDKRESVYCRKELSKNQIEPLVKTKAIHAQYWIYIPQKDYTHQHPKKTLIATYYRDLFLKGCQEIEDIFKLHGYYKQCLASIPSNAKFQ